MQAVPANGVGFGPLLQKALLNPKCQALASGASPNPCKMTVALALPHLGYADGTHSDKQLQQLKQLICLGEGGGGEEGRRKMD